MSHRRVFKYDRAQGKVIEVTAFVGYEPSGYLDVQYVDLAGMFGGGVGGGKSKTFDANLNPPVAQAVDAQGNPLGLHIVADPRCPPGQVFQMFALGPVNFGPTYGGVGGVDAAGEDPVKEPVSEELTTELEGWRCWNWILPPAVDYMRMGAPNHSFKRVDQLAQRRVPRCGLPLLKSWWTDHVWPGPMLRSDRTPIEHRRHGVHAFKNRRQARAHAADTDILNAVIGRVALSGIVCCYQRGYRAEVAMIQELQVQQSYAGFVGQDVLRALGAFYQCPVTIKPDFTDRTYRLLAFMPGLASDWFDPELDPVIG